MVRALATLIKRPGGMESIQHVGDIVIADVIKLCLHVIGPVFYNHENINMAANRKHCLTPTPACHCERTLRMEIASS